MATQLFVDNMAEPKNAVDGDSACGDAYSWKDRKCNIALITGITGQVNTLIACSCHDRCCLYFWTIFHYTVLFGGRGETEAAPFFSNHAPYRMDSIYAYV